MLYTTGGKTKRYFKYEESSNGGSGKVTRISSKEYDETITNPGLGLTQPNAGDKVIIIVKPYHMHNCHTGIVQNVLTRRKIHTRGHKVRLTTGVIGRTLKILKKNEK